jgi:cell division transport system permease protein
MFGYLISEGIKNVFKNKKSTSGSLAIMCATMLIFGLFFVIIENINNMVTHLEEQQGISVFIEKEASNEQIEAVGDAIKKVDGVNGIKFVSKDEALNTARARLKNNQKLLAGWESDNPFRASYVVTLTSLEKSEEVQNEIYKIENVASITSKDDTVKALIVVANFVRIVSWAIIALLIIISVFIISNTIKLTVHARRKEISIMKYVGATDSFIRWPFIIEGIAIGIIAGAISIAVVGLLYTICVTEISSSEMIHKMGIALLPFNQMASLITLVYLLIGIGIGTLGSAISMRKYLNV